MLITGRDIRSFQARSSGVGSPPDFDAFWEATVAEATRAAGDIEQELLTGPVTTLDVSAIAFRGWRGKDVRGWLISPRTRARSRRPCVVEFLGYSGTRSHVLDHLAWASAGYVHVVVEPGRVGRATGGISTRARYHYRAVIANGVLAVRAAARHGAVDPERVAVAGASQGGGVAVAVSALTEVAAVVADVPYGCSYPLAIATAREGPYREIADLIAREPVSRDRALTTLGYYDVTHFASRARAPGLFSLATLDRTCPPATVLSAYKQYGGPKRLQVWEGKGHESGESLQQEAALAFVDETLRNGGSR